MQLYTNPASPFCRKVEVTIIETGQQADVEFIAAVGNALESPKLLSDVNPIGKIPVLIRDGGNATFDSRVICRYLNDRVGADLYSEANLWDVMTLEALGDGICEGAVLMVYEGRTRPPEMQYAPWVEGQWAKVARALDDLERQWMELLNASLNAGQIAVGCALGYLDFRHGDRNWRAGHRALAEWYEAFSQRASMQETRPEQ